MTVTCASHDCHMHVMSHGCRLGVMRRRTVESDTVSLCDVRGERERREGRGGGSQERGETSSPPVGRHHGQLPSSHSPVSDEGARGPPPLSSLPPPRLPPPSTPSPLAAETELTARALESDGPTGGQVGGRRREGSIRGRIREERLEQKTKEVRASKVLL